MFRRKTMAQRLTEEAQKEKRYCLLGRVKPEHVKDLAQATTTALWEWFEEEVTCSNCGKVFPSSDCEEADNHRCEMTSENLLRNLQALAGGSAEEVKR